MDKDFEGKYAVVTGATSGINACSAKLLAERGLSGLVIIGRNEERGKAVAEACEAFGCKTEFCACDVTDIAKVQETIEHIRKVLPRVDILVNGAAVSPYDDPWDTEPVEHFDLILNTNLRSQFMFCQAFGKDMKANGYGKIVNFSSCVARTGSGLSLSYAASKAGVAAMTRSLAKTIGYKVNVNAVLPGVINTPMLAGHDYSEQAKAWPLGRMGEPEELAEAVAFLASDKASYMTGACVDVNGGYVFS